MPETYFRVHWPDGTTERCYSPSLVVEEFFEYGGTYPLEEFVDRSRQALTIGSERVRARYGFGCGSAAAQIAHIEHKARTFAEGGAVIVEGFER